MTTLWTPSFHHHGSGEKQRRSDEPDHSAVFDHRTGSGREEGGGNLGRPTGRGTGVLLFSPSSAKADTVLLDDGSSSSVALSSFVVSIRRGYKESMDVIVAVTRAIIEAIMRDGSECISEEPRPVFAMVGTHRQRRTSAFWFFLSFVFFVRMPQDRATARQKREIS